METAWHAETLTLLRELVSRRAEDGDDEESGKEDGGDDGEAEEVVEGKGKGKARK
jgi:hypothetical protein